MGIFTGNFRDAYLLIQFRISMSEIRRFLTSTYEIQIFAVANYILLLNLLRGIFKYPLIH